MSDFKPILASALKTEKDWAKVKYPVIATPKLDGIRILKIEGELLTRSFKKVRNSFIQSCADQIPDGLDGEIITYKDEACTEPFEFNSVQSHVMKGDSGHDHFWRFHAFDDFTVPTLPYVERLASTYQKCELSPYCEYVEHVLVEDYDTLMTLAAKYVDEGYEGTMIRKPLGEYKFGRSSVNEGLLLKIKKFDDTEGTIIGTTQLMSNQNEIIINELGQKTRRGLKEGMVPREELGSLIMKWDGGEDFEVGTGFTKAQREDLWKRRDEIIGETVTFKYQGVGTHNRPRFPVFMGFRYDK